VATKETIKIVPYDSITKVRYDKGELSKILKGYKSGTHLTYISKSKYTDFDFVDGAAIQTITKVLEYVETDVEKKVRLEIELSSIEKQAELLQARITAKGVLGLVSNSLQKELKIVLEEHLNISYNLALLS
jgi:hypothetical protein